MVLRGAMPELWLVFAIKFLGIAAYKVTVLTLILWLRSQFGYSDVSALALVAVWSLTFTACTLLVGSLTDALGLRKTFFLGVCVCVFARAVMAFSTHTWLALGAGLFPLALGEALGTPVLIAAVRRYSNTRQRSMSFSVFYIMMNAGFFIAAKIFDLARRGWGEHGQATLPLVGVTLTTYQLLLLGSLLLELTLLPFIYCLREGAEATDEGVVIASNRPRYAGANYWKAFSFTVRDAVTETTRLFGSLVRQSGFYRLLGFLLFIAFLKLIFMQNDAVLPTFGIREMGEGAPVGALLGINNLLIILLVPLVGALTQRFSAYRMVILGGAISAASVFVMALPQAWFEPLAHGLLGHWLGHLYLGLDGTVHPYYMMIAIFVIILSIGEAFYSPRVYEYAAAIAPKGQEASYGALSYIPFLLAKLLVGTLSAQLLARYCPQVGPRHSNIMWLVIALTASIAPVGLFLLRRFIRVHEVGRDD